MFDKAFWQCLVGEKDYKNPKASFWGMWHSLWVVLHLQHGGPGPVNMPSSQHPTPTQPIKKKKKKKSYFY